jgi:hypothetical protein
MIALPGTALWASAALSSAMSLSVAPAEGWMQLADTTAQAGPAPPTADSVERGDSWNRGWTFFEWRLRPYGDPSAGGSGF